MSDCTHKSITATDLWTYAVLPQPRSHVPYLHVRVCRWCGEQQRQDGAEWRVLVAHYPGIPWGYRPEPHWEGGAITVSGVMLDIRQLTSERKRELELIDDGIWPDSRRTVATYDVSGGGPKT